MRLAMLAAVACLGVAAPASEPAGSQPDPVIATVPEVGLHIATPTRMPSWVALELRERNPSLERVAKRLGRAEPEIEKELKLVRFRHFKSGNVEQKQVGLSRLRELVTTETLPMALEIVRREDDEVRGAVLDALLLDEGPEVAVALAWVGMHAERSADRTAAVARLDSVLTPGHEQARNDVAYLIARTLRKADQDARARAASLANQFSIVQALPHLIAAQLGGTGGEIDDDAGDRAYIFIGQQTGFVSDLTPVVADSAVAFDPTISVLNTGVVLRIIDSQAIIYHMDIHHALTGLVSRAWGQDMSDLGFDQDRWWRWFSDEFQPAWAERVANAAQRDDG